MSIATNLYLVLGVDEDASPEQIQAAYGHWAQEAQPDRDSPATGAFEELQDAYSVLGHPERRHAHEARMKARASVQQPRAEALRAPAAARGADIELPLQPPDAECHPSFEELFERLWSNFSLLTRPKAENLESLTVEIPLAQTEAERGGHARILIPARVQCAACLGHGALGLYQCWRCQGHGAITADYPLEVAYPAGIRNEYEVQVPLSRFGIENFYLTVRFRVTQE